MHSKFPIQDTKDTTLTHAKGGRGKLAPLSSPLQKHLLMTSAQLVKEKRGGMRCVEEECLLWDFGECSIYMGYHPC